MTPDELKKCGLRVKPLVWVELEQDRGDGTTDLTGNHEAVSNVGTYETELSFGSDAYYWSVARDWEEIGHSFEGPIYAKAAAQADYESRIMAALEAVSDPILAAEVRGMERAAEIMDRRHAEFMGGKGRNPADYTSAYTMSAAAIRAAAREIKP